MYHFTLTVVIKTRNTALKHYISAVFTKRAHGLFVMLAVLTKITQDSLSFDYTYIDYTCNEGTQRETIVSCDVDAMLFTYCVPTRSSLEEQ